MAPDQSSTPADGGWRPGATVLGEFVVERQLGGGGSWRMALVRDGRGERHAVRRVPSGDLVAQRRSRTEIERWIGLPGHPHLAACRFVRILGDKLLVFSEYAGGGSLADWIRDGRLYAGDDPVPAVLRVAVETALALDAAHTMGVPHLNVKPANVLLTEDGSVKLTGFGAVREPVHLRQLEVDGTIRAAPEGAYAAPEQAEDQPVGRGADVWSWAVVVLEMFAGVRTWPSGALADAVLAELVAQDRWRVAMPPAVVELLRGCLRFDPIERPRSLGDLAASLTDLATKLGVPERPRPPRPSVPHLPAPRHGGADPKAWLHYAYQTAGRDPWLAAMFWPSGYGRRDAEDLRALAVARRELDQAAGPVWARARLRADTGRVALRAGELGTAAANLRACAGLLAGRSDEDSRLLLAAVLTDLAAAVRQDEDPVPLHDWAISVAEELPGHPGVLAEALLAKADTVGELELYDRAEAAYQRAGDADGVVAAVIAKARALHSAGATEQADRVLAVEREVDEVAAGRLALERASLAGSAVTALGHARAVVDLFTPPVREHGRYELAGELGRGWLLAGLALERLARPGRALAAFRTARVMLAAAVVRDGRAELATELATAYDREETLVREHGSPRAGAEVAGRAVELWQRLADLDEPGTWTEELATARERFGTALLAAGETGEAGEQFDEVLRLLPESEIGGSERRRDLAAMAHRQQGVLLARAGDPIRACGHYQHALYLLADAEEPGFTRVLVLESLSAALADADHLDESVQVLQQAAEELGLLVRRGLRGEADLADTNRRLANALLELGDFRAAAATARTGLTQYERLIAGGRADLAEPAAKLRASFGWACHRLSEVDLAIVAIGDARTVLGADEVVAHGLDAQLGTLREVTALEPAGLDKWFAGQREALLDAEELSRAGQTGEASRRVEEVVGNLGWLIRTRPTERGYAMCGQAGVQLGMAALHARRNGAAQHGFEMAMDCYAMLVDNGLRQYVEDWARAYLGLASLLTVLGDDEGAEDVVTELLANLGDVDREAVPRWRDRAGRMVAEMRVTRG